VLCHQWLKWPGRAGDSGDGRVDGVVGNLAHFEHEITLFNMDNTTFSLTSEGSCYSRGALTGAGG